MRDDRNTRSRCLLDCGDVANKKVGLIWVCDYHYNRFGVPSIGEEQFENCTGAIDADTAQDFKY